MSGQTTRIGLKKCGACRKQFTVKVGTVFESSHIPLHKWLQATYLKCASKKGISALQIQRTLEITYKSAWFMCHRIREAMKEGGFSPMSGSGNTVEVDETYVGGKEGNKHISKKGAARKAPVVLLIERSGRVRSFHIPEVTAKNVAVILHSQVSKQTSIMTHESPVYTKRFMGDFASHQTVNHSAGEYFSRAAHINGAENYFGLLKRGITGTFHHVSQQQLNRYVAEFDFRYNQRNDNDGCRTDTALKGIARIMLNYCY